MTKPALVTGRLLRWLLILGGWLALVLGIIGAFLPVMPTVPFLLVALACFTRSSPRLAQWLRAHPQWGPQLLAWEERGAVPRRAKWFATLMMLCSGSFSLFIAPLPWGLLPALAFACVLPWLWRRPDA